MATASLIVTTIYSTSYSTISTNNALFIGWKVTSTGIVSLTEAPYSCGTSSFWTTSGRFAQCCGVKDECWIFTTCLSSSVVVASQGSRTCGSSQTCGFDLILNKYPGPDSAVSKAQCVGPGGGNTYARAVVTSSVLAQTISITIPVTPSPSTTSALPSSTTMSSLAAQMSSSSLMQTVLVTSGTSSLASVSTSPSLASIGGGFASQTPGPVTTSDGDSKAWIAAAVVAPVVVLLLIAALAWWLIKRRQRNAVVTMVNEKPVMMPM